MQALWSDLRIAARRLRGAPGFSAAAVLALALGIALVTVMFSAVDRVLLRPLPFAEPERLLALHQTDRAGAGENDGVAPPVALAWRERARTLDGVAAIEPYGFDLTDRGTPETIAAWRVTEDFFPILGVSAWRGRTLMADDFDAGGVVVLGHDLWQRRFGADTALVGRTLTLDGEPHVVAGIMPPGFGFPEGGEFWAPRRFDERERAAWSEDYFQVVARLADGVTPAQARAELETLTAALGSDAPEAAGLGVVVRSLFDDVVGGARPILLALLGAVACILLIACVNVASLLLARGVRRRREFAVRRALGATGGRIVRLLFAESALLAVAGSLLGVLLAVWGAEAATALVPAGLLPRGARIGLDGRALLFAAGAGLATALVCGMAPALRARRADLRTPMQDDGAAIGQTGLRRVGAGLIAAQVALAVTLLIGAGQFGRSLLNLLQQDPGFEPEGRVALQVFIWDRYENAELRSRFVADAVARLEAVPGVRSAGAVSALPYAKAWIAMEDEFTVVGRVTDPSDRLTTYVTLATPGYFPSAGIPLREGRPFGTTDGPDAPPVALVNETMARRWWPAGNAVGARVVIGAAGPPLTREVVGVVGDVRQAGLDREPRPELFVPHAQSGFGSMTFVVHAGSDPSAVLPSLRAAIWDLRPDLPIYDSATLQQLLAGSLGERRFVALLLGAFAAVASLLTAIGIYGVVAFLTGQRMREFGIRLALGATPRGIVADTVRGSAFAIGVGALLGAAGAALLAASLRRLLFAVGVADPGTWALLLPAVLVVGVVAAWLPARRAGRADPVIVMRSE